MSHHHHHIGGVTGGFSAMLLAAAAASAPENVASEEKSVAPCASKKKKRALTAKTSTVAASDNENCNEESNYEDSSSVTKKKKKQVRIMTIMTEEDNKVYDETFAQGAQPYRTGAVTLTKREVLYNMEDRVAKLCDPQLFPTTNPDHLLKALLEDAGHPYKTVLSLSAPGFFRPVTQERVTAYYVEDVIKATRNGDLTRLRGLYESGCSMDACNPFGESLLHMACRRGYFELIKFFIEEAKICPRICDDQGRNPLHDACWTVEPAYKCVKLLIEQDPALLLMGDKRGHTPMQYLREENWGSWCLFVAMCNELELLHPLTNDHV
mmetsp:Transcript_18050/g.26841  ORF Transcript_18050/g.26841 Transcript_18050/m.26841 type:complete len:323 (-) Transcript_18050:289-1257(-)|eukprot:CAMPEP_0116026456 /NCGR_PEP_ID=MMETSP0321-20121206/13863_1 /TAXON_ID=163516 /ORGANISM="Leptocylindrus danicus var. danicus, Strain B650" /LENGTH=322 /DNA_ID=CAMNT_0003499261 /DNA_START=45 /DNA_END=1013 /DNA_ORIENTATION=+